jgi:hypothetical protein
MVLVGSHCELDSLLSSPRKLQGKNESRVGKRKAACAELYNLGELTFPKTPPPTPKNDPIYVPIEMNSPNPSIPHQCSQPYIKRKSRKREGISRAGVSSNVPKKSMNRKNWT